MVLLNAWTKSIFAITIAITMFEPTTAELRNFMRQLIEEPSGACKHSPCDKSPTCPTGYTDSISRTRDYCGIRKEKKLCCKHNKGPQCFFTECRISVCPRYYHKIDRTHNGCSGSHRTFCCKSKDIPPCFDLSCPAANEAEKMCPPDFNEIARARGRLGECDSNFTERVSCCFPGFQIGNYGNQIVNITTSYIVNQGVNPTPGYNVNQGYNPTTGYNRSQGYYPTAGYNRTQGYNPTAGYNVNQGYNPTAGYNRSQGYNPTPGYNRNQGVNPTAGYNRTQGANLNNSTKVKKGKRTYEMQNGHIVYVGNSPTSFGAFYHSLLLLPMLIVLSTFKSNLLF